MIPVHHLVRMDVGDAEEIDEERGEGRQGPPDKDAAAAAVVAAAVPAVPEPNGLQAPHCCQRECLTAIPVQILQDYVTGFATRTAAQRQHSIRDQIRTWLRLPREPGTQSWQKPQLFGQPICRKAFAWLHSISLTQVRRYVSWLCAHPGSAEWQRPRQKGAPRDEAVRNGVAAFLASYQAEYALPDPNHQEYRELGDRQANSADGVPVPHLLPSGTTKQAVYDKYVESCAVLRGNVPVVRRKHQHRHLPNEPCMYHHFIHLWDQLYPWLRIAPPGTDLCNVCTKFKLQNRTHGGLRDEDRREWHLHTQAAKDARQFYKRVSERSRQLLLEHIGEAGHDPEQLPFGQYRADVTTHMVFDFGQSTATPRFSEQPAKMFFLSEHTTQLFTVYDLTRKKGVMFIYGEAEAPAKPGSREEPTRGSPRVYKEARVAAIQAAQAVGEGAVAAVQSAVAAAATAAREEAANDEDMDVDDDEEKEAPAEPGAHVLALYSDGKAYEARFVRSTDSGYEVVYCESGVKHTCAVVHPLSQGVVPWCAEPGNKRQAARVKAKVQRFLKSAAASSSSAAASSSSAIASSSSSSSSRKKRRHVGTASKASKKKKKMAKKKAGGMAEKIDYKSQQRKGERGAVSKNPDVVVSMLHTSVEMRSLSEEHLFLHADNCAGQNKNKTVLAYLMWRVLTGRHKRITLGFMQPGHTKNECDGTFGRLKKLLGKKTAVYTTSDVLDVARGRNDLNEVIPMAGEDIPWLRWGAYLEQFFHGFKGISSYYYFHFDQRYPGTVVVVPSSRSSVDNQGTHYVQLLKPGVTKEHVLGLNMRLGGKDLAPLSHFLWGLLPLEMNRYKYLSKTIGSVVKERKDYEAVRRFYTELGRPPTDKPARVLNTAQLAMLERLREEEKPNSAMRRQQQQLLPEWPEDPRKGYNYCKELVYFHDLVGVGGEVARAENGVIENEASD